MPLVKHAVDCFGRLVSLLMGIAIDIDEGVFGPVRRRLARQGREVRLALEKAVEPLDLLVATVGVGHGIDEDHEVLPNAPDHRLLRSCQAIGQFKDGFRRAVSSEWIAALK